MKTLIIVALTCMVGATAAARAKLEQDLLPDPENLIGYHDSNGAYPEGVPSE